MRKIEIALPLITACICCFKYFMQLTIYKPKLPYNSSFAETCSKLLLLPEHYSKV